MKPNPLQPPAPYSAWAWLLLTLVIPLGTLLAAALTLEPWKYQALDPLLLFAAASAFTVPVPLVYLWIGRRLLRPPHLFAQPMPPLIAATLLAWLGSVALLAPTLNGRLDAGEGMTIVAPIEGKHIAEGNRGASHRLHLASWRQPGTAEIVTVSMSEYERAVPGRSNAILVVRPGRFGLPWVARCQVQ